jgi:cellulose synthase/poly-beta-1,6-N-acetylglucosamine synthase-like glycosyltransferase
MYLAEDRVRGKCDVNVIWTFFLIQSLHRSYAGNWCQNVARHGFFTTSSLHTLLPTRRIRCASDCLGAACRFDPPFQVPELISQRRGWLNGSFFAAIHSTVKSHYIYRSSHSFARKLWIHVELLYQTFNLILSWFSLVRFPCS